MSAHTLARAIRDAVDAEAAAARFYRSLASRSEDRTVRRFFEDMGRIEQGHQQEIDDMGRKLLAGRIPPSDAADAAVVETAPQWRDAEDLTLLEALQVALECENQAALYYDALADSFGPPGAGFFQMLARAEEQHARMIEQAVADHQARHPPVLTLAQAVRNAIAAEQASAAFYLQLARKTHDVEARKFLDKMIAVEQLHAAEIQRLSRSLLQGPLAERANVRVEAIETAPDWSFGEQLDLDGALHVALEAERRAAVYYATVAGYFEGSDAEFFRDLADTERRHAEMITEALRNRLGQTN